MPFGPLAPGVAIKRTRGSIAPLETRLAPTAAHLLMMFSAAVIKPISDSVRNRPRASRP